MCKEKILGRRDKKFCSTSCKSEYHRKLRKVTKGVTLPVDKVLHRNRSILLEVMGKRGTKKMINRSVLDEKKFNFNYMTGYYVNSKNKTYHYIYDFSYMVFSEEKIMINRMKKY